MSVQNSRASINKALQDLQTQWLTARGSWDDVVAEEFEKKFLEPLMTDFKPAATAMDHIGTVLSAMRRDCSEQT